MARNRDFAFSRRYYRLLLRLYPSPLRASCGTAMEAVFIASVRILVEKWGSWGIPVAFLRVLGDSLWHAAALRRRAFASGVTSREKWLSGQLGEDVWFAAKHLARSRRFTATSVGALALGIGLSTAVFGAAYSLLMRPLSGAKDTDELVQIYRASGDGAEFLPSSLPLLRDLRADNEVFSGVAASAFTPLSVSSGHWAERVVGQVVSSNFFDVLGVSLARGGGFPGDGDDPRRGERVVVLSHGFWENHFGGDPSVIGKALGINGSTWQVVGVAPADFRGSFPTLAPALWAPLSMHAELMRIPDQSEARGNNFLDVIGRLEPGRGIQHATSWAVGLAAQLREEHPEFYEALALRLSPQNGAGIHPSLRTAQVGLSGAMMGMVALLLCVAIMNVGVLVLVEGRTRQRELAVRRSIGASRARLVRQLLLESLMLSLLAGTGGVALAKAMLVGANRLRVPAGWPVELSITLGSTALLFALGMTVLAGAVLGLGPALGSRSLGVASSLRRQGAGRDRGGRRVGQLLIGGQVAVSTTLLAFAGLFAVNLRDALEVDTGFDRDQVLVATLDPGLQGYDRAETERIFAALLGRIRKIPGVRAVGLARDVPLTGVGSQRGVEIPGYAPVRGESMNIPSNLVDPGYFAAAGIPFVEGRGFRRSGSEHDELEIVVNRRFAERFWPGEKAAGKVLVSQGRSWTVVGVVPTGKYRSLGEEPVPFAYFPWPMEFSPAMTLHVKTVGRPDDLVPLLREAVAEIDANSPLYGVRTMREQLGFALLPARVAAILLGGLGASCLVLLVVGVDGVVSHGVSQRTREVGIRVALGAEPWRVTAQLMKEEATVVAVGLAIGSSGALLAVQWVQRLLYAGGAEVPAALVGASMFLLLVAATACYRPARRATLTDPARVLRDE